MMFDIRALNSELRKIAEEKLNENSEIIDKMLKEFCEWIDEKPHLRARKDDQFLIAFLRCCKFDLKKAQMQLEIFYTLRHRMPDLIKNRDPTSLKLKSIIKLGVGIPLPYTDQLGGPRLYLIRPGAFDPTYFKIQDVIKVCTMINEILMRDDDNWTICGQIGILDLARVSSLHLMQLCPTVIKKWTQLSQDAFPVRLRGFHYINAPPGFNEIFKTFLSTMTEEMRTKVYVHGYDLESFHKIIPRYLMPKEYGGSIYTIRDVIKEWEDKIFSYRQYFEEEDEQFGIDESKKIPEIFEPKTEIE